MKVGRGGVGKNLKLTRSSSKDSDQPVHTCSLIFNKLINKEGLGHWLAIAHPAKTLISLHRLSSLCRAHMTFCRVCTTPAHFTAFAM